MSDTPSSPTPPPTPAAPPGPPPAAGERRAERVGIYWHIYERTPSGLDAWVGSAETEADARLLAYGGAALVALEDFLIYTGAGKKNPWDRIKLLLYTERTRCRNPDDQDFWQFVGDKLTIARLALARVRPAAGEGQDK